MLVRKINKFLLNYIKYISIYIIILCKHTSIVLNKSSIVLSKREKRCNVIVLAYIDEILDLMLTQPYEIR